MAELISILSDSQYWLGSSGFLMRMIQHVVITLVVLGISSAIAIPLGLVCGHKRWGTRIFGTILGASRAIPSLGLLVLLGLWLGIGPLAPTIALVILVIPSLFAGAYAGILNVDRAVVDAAYSMGYSSWQVLRLVELPLGSKLIVGGIREAMLQASATATLVAYTSNIGLGRIIFTGLKSNDYALMLAGALLVILLTFVLDIMCASLQKVLQRRLGYQ